MVDIHLNASCLSTQIHPYSPPLWGIVVFYKHHFADIPNVFQIWSTLAGYEESAVEFEPVTNREIF